MKKICLGLFLSGSLLSVSAYATDDNIESIDLSMTAASAPHVAAFYLESGSPISVKLLDYAWDNRENIKNQQIIANYLITQPEVPKDYEAAWKTARLVNFIGNFGLGEKDYVSSNDGARLFYYGLLAAKVAIKIQPNNVEGQYWYAVNLGSYGLAKSVLAAAADAKDGMSALRHAIAIDPSYQWYGSNRILGRYYQELPGLFGGDNTKALELLKTATEKAPQFRNNWVFLGQYYIKTRAYESAIETCQKALSLPNQDGKYEEIRYTREANECISNAKSKAMAS